VKRSWQVGLTAGVKYSVSRARRTLDQGQLHVTSNGTLTVTVSPILDMLASFIHYPVHMYSRVLMCLANPLDGELHSL